MSNVEWEPKKWLSLLLAILIGPFSFLYANSARLFWCFLIGILCIGLGGVYFGVVDISSVRWIFPALCFFGVVVFVVAKDDFVDAVSYTHLTLPTIYSV